MRKILKNLHVCQSVEISTFAQKEYLYDVTIEWEIINGDDTCSYRKDKRLPQSRIAGFISEALNSSIEPEVKEYLKGI